MESRVHSRGVQTAYWGSWCSAGGLDTSGLEERVFDLRKKHLFTISVRNVAAAHQLHEAPQVSQRLRQAHQLVVAGVEDSQR